MVSIYETMKKRRETLLKSISEIELKLKLLPDGFISVKNHRNKAYYYMSSGHVKDVYLSSENESFETSKTPLDVRVIDNLINTHFR